jgi:hypothetical protein
VLLHHKRSPPEISIRNLPDLLDPALRRLTLIITKGKDAQALRAIEVQVEFVPGPNRQPGCNICGAQVSEVFAIHVNSATQGINEPVCGTAPDDGRIFPDG